MRAIEKSPNGQVVPNSHVEQILIEDGRAAGVRLRNGKTIGASRAVVSNADVHTTKKLVPAGASQPLDEYLSGLTSWYSGEEHSTSAGGFGGPPAAIPPLRSFIHLHAGQ